MGDFRVDILVNELIIVELKAVETVHAKFYAQLNNYLRSTEVEVGLLINFSPKGVETKRKVLTNERKPNLTEILSRRLGD
ncbi:MAG: GxxExxY protein [Paraglaciecola sp.]|jgi:GxxExxY protein